MNALLSSALPSLAGIASATNNAAMQLGNAITTGVTQMMLVLAIALLLAAVLVWFALRSYRQAR